MPQLHEAQVATVYKLFFLFIEPISALIGAYYSYNQQQTYLDLTHAASSPKSGIPTSTQIVLAQLSNLYFLFAINEAFVLRSTTDLNVWRALLVCLLMADIGHLYSVKAVGWQIYWNVLGWNAIDWGNIAFVYAGASMRISFLLGIGVGPPGQIGIIDGKPNNTQWGVKKAGKPRERLVIACTTCREKKIKCDPAEPKCVQCEKFGRKCRFTTALPSVRACLFDGAIA